eukprot:PITA_06704
MSSLVKLEHLDLGVNHFSGSIPREYGKLKNLEYLSFSSNRLSGRIPGELGNFGNLKVLYLGNFEYEGNDINRFNGGIPTEIGNLSKLVHLDMNGCGLNGSIPAEIGCLKNLETMYLLAPLLFCLLLLVAGAAVYKGRARAVKKIVDTRLWEMTTFQKLDFGSDDIVQCLKEENIIGEGGAGVVYRGIMPNGQQIAVKKLTGIGMGSLNDHGFSAEVKTLGKIRHRHIVTLLAFCSNHDTNLLVYEYMANGSLGELLHGNNGGHLNWDSRYKIAVETAKGLRYIHHDCSPLILHRDVKSNNILLDSNFEAHIADFGLAKLLHHSGASECMSSIAGSFGYIAPEYAYTLKVEEKSDIYSFGVVLLELITGKRPVGECEFEEGMNLAGWVKKMTKLERGKVMEITDPKLSDFPMEEAMHMFFVALLCLQEQPKHRPSMREIAHMLTHCKPRL